MSEQREPYKVDGESIRILLRAIEESADISSLLSKEVGVAAALETLNRQVTTQVVDRSYNGDDSELIHDFEATVISHEPDAGLTAIFNKIENGNDDLFTFDDLLYVLGLLKNDKAINGFYAKMKEIEPYYNTVIDSCGEFGIDICDHYPDFNWATLESIQAMIQNTSCLSDAISEETWEEGPHDLDPQSITFNYAKIHALKEFGVEVQAVFDILPPPPFQGDRREFGDARIYYVFENFTLEV